MKLISYTHQEVVRYGVLVAQGVADMRHCMDNAPASINDFFAHVHSNKTLIASIAQRAESAPHLSLDQVNLLPCVPRPSKIICLGVNYHDHAAEGGNKVADYPTIFYRGPSSLLAHKGTIPIPPISTSLDFEAELALVIGKTTRNVSEAEALDSVFAYACFNDATFRDYQRKTTQWTVGKNFDQTGGFGPHLVTADELPPGCVGLHIESRLNGKVMQSASTTDMVFHVAPTIAMMSACMTLEPGDVIVMGTPAGVGYARKPPVWMQPGDTIEIEVEGIGILSNQVGLMAA
ncbi:fumarylacetoacetate hydrolase family protein [Limnohabitans sp. Rim11]|uniref:fumarylacetoacetate hydrolase family protein n=1 Tax=Limnohabitans sp. Rim11 TaxID=1100719 RepID=UPI000AC70463|nr:fumarylacetoacetate hydrolase family protein [Limnohabitans sp. Rim11]